MANGARFSIRQPGFTLVELMIVVAIIAILAMVAIPAFVKYVRRSKTVEATMNVRKLYDSSVSYYESERAGRGTKASILARRFPPTWCTMTPQGDVPSPVPPPTAYQCCKGPGGKCPSWSVIEEIDRQGGGHGMEHYFIPLNFTIDGPFYFHYGYLSSGSELESIFTAQAFGNLDCDSDWSTYERAGSVDDHGNVVGSGLYINNDIE
jgi:prepilin-type N-terminal cleavage/methylation domain-containing protein